MFNMVRCDICNTEIASFAWNTFGDTIICTACQDNIRRFLFRSPLFLGSYFYRFLANNYLWLAHEFDETSQSDNDILVAKFCRFVKDNDFNF